ncbi:MAG: hypothetical protein NBKEAIPA_01588 [Nitrospirae bacterium]|nr:MAG: hypothetical protein UZ03_NOB001000663 [Nitrospira sp. OLB3]MBV6469686.1 hypothetical protein [Nitrospirota bacterium]
MEEQPKQQYVKPELVAHELLRDVTAIAISRVQNEQFS